MHRYLIGALVLMSASLPCAAGEAFTARYSACVERSNGVTADMLDCIAAELATQDARLNAAYRTLTSQLGPERKQQLVATQRLWIQYRDANCGFYADPDGGTLATLSSNQCMLDETTRRAAELETLGRVY